MNAFHSAREAKEFLASRIVEEAERENVALSEVERKMLYFSETDWTLPDMSEISDAFDREYDQDEYEKKISLLIDQAAKRDRKESPALYRSWWDAIRHLKREDHYILVMISAAGLRPPGDQLKLFGTAILLVTFLVAIGLLKAFLSQKYGIDFERHMPSGDAIAFFIWITAACVVVGYFLLRFIIGEKRADDLISRPWRRQPDRLNKDFSTRD